MTSSQDLVCREFHHQQVQKKRVTIIKAILLHRMVFQMNAYMKRKSAECRARVEATQEDDYFRSWQDFLDDKVRDGYCVAFNCYRRFCGPSRTPCCTTTTFSRAR